MEFQPSDLRNLIKSPEKCFLNYIFEVSALLSLSKRTIVSHIFYLEQIKSRYSVRMCMPILLISGRTIQKKGCLWKVSCNNSNVWLLSAMGARPMTASDCRDGGSGASAATAAAHTSLCPARPRGVAAATTVQPLVKYSVMAEAVGCRLLAVQ